MEINVLEKWLWDAACAIRGEVDAPKFKDYILPLLFYKRLCDVFEDELGRVADRLVLTTLVEAQQVVEQDRQFIRFYIPQAHTWTQVCQDKANLGQNLTSAMTAIVARNPKLKGVLDRYAFNRVEGGQRILEDDTLARLIEILSQHRLGLTDVEADMLGRAYEFLLRKFAEGGGQSAGEFFTPREVGLLMATILNPQEGDTVYDPACGSGGLLIKAQLRLREKLNGAKEIKPLQLYGQEINPDTFAMAKMNAFLHDMEATIYRGDTIANPQTIQASKQLMHFDKVIANPMWNQNIPLEVYEKDVFKRFIWGYPLFSSADWGWIQHMAASLTSKGKMAVILDTGAASRGSGSLSRNRERDIRRAFVEADWVELVVLLPHNLFYNTEAAGIILVINKAKRYPGQVLLINASQQYYRKRPKNLLETHHTAQIFELYNQWQVEDKLSIIVSTEILAQNDYNLSPNRYIVTTEIELPPPPEEAVILLAQAEETRDEVDKKLHQVLQKLGLKIN